MLIEDEKKFLSDAYQFLEKQSLLIKVANIVGKPLEMAQQALPEKSQQLVHQAVEKSLHSMVRLSMSMVSQSEEFSDFKVAASKTKKTKWTHTGAVTVSGGVGGFFGLLALPLELPVTTAIIFRSIASIADDFGMDFKDPQTSLDCLYVLTLGSNSKHNSEMDSSYFSSRIALAQSMSHAAEYIAAHSAKEVLAAMNKGSAPALLKFIGKVSAALEVSVSQKILAKSIPIVGTISSAAINAAFASYFSDVARYHFGIKALEKKYGVDHVQELYLRHAQKAS